MTAHSPESTRRHALCSPAGPMEEARTNKAVIGALALVASLAMTGCLAKGVKLMAGGTSHELRKRPEGAPPNSPSHPPILVLALDGVGRDILYESLRKGEMPELARLLGGGEAGRFPHAYLDESLIS